MKQDRQSLPFLVGLMAGVLLLVACGADDPVPASPAARPASPTGFATNTPLPAATLVETADPEVQAPALTEAPVSGDACLACHADRDRLIDSADPEQEVMSESKGEG